LSIVFKCIGTSSTSNPLTFFDGFGRNPFSLLGVELGGNPFQSSWNPSFRYVPMQGKPTGNQYFQLGDHFGRGLPPFGQVFHPSYKNLGFQVNSFWQLGANKNPRSLFPYSNKPGSTPFRIWNEMQQPRLPFLEALNFVDISKFMNDPMCYDLTCPPVPTKLPLDIPKFEGKASEDHDEHIMIFH